MRLKSSCGHVIICSRSVVDVEGRSYVVSHDKVSYQTSNKVSLRLKKCHRLQLLWAVWQKVFKINFLPKFDISFLRKALLFLCWKTYSLLNWFSRFFFKIIMIRRRSLLVFYYHIKNTLFMQRPSAFNKYDIVYRRKKNSDDSIF